MRRRGFTLIEMLITVTLIGILVRIALPRLSDLNRRAVAAAIVADFAAVRVAAYDYNASTGLWPPESGTGVVPPLLVASLPKNFSFTRKGYQLDWENWSAGAKGGVLLGISVVTTDQKLGQAVVKLLRSGNAARFTVGNSYTFVLQAAGGVL